MDEALRKIAERINTSQALSEKHEVTRTYELKVVAEHFRKNLFNWEEESVRIHVQHGSGWDFYLTKMTSSVME